MNKIQRLRISVVKDLLKNEVWLYGRQVTPYNKMMKVVKKRLFTRKECIDTLKYLDEKRRSE